MMASFDFDDDRGLPVRKLGEQQVLNENIHKKKQIMAFPSNFRRWWGWKNKLPVQILWGQVHRGLCSDNIWELSQGIRTWRRE